jgi:hypothetical protein
MAQLTGGEVESLIDDVGLSRVLTSPSTARHPAPSALICVHRRKAVSSVPASYCSRLSGRTLRFNSMSELHGFMQGVLARKGYGRT